MKHNINQMAAVLLLCFAVLLCGSQASAQTEQPQNLYDGYLVGLTDPAGAQLFSDWADSPAEYVSETVCWVPTLEDANALVEQGAAAYVEPNYIATLFETVTEEEPAEPITLGWPYEAIRGDVAQRYGLTGNTVRVGLIDSGVDLDNADLQNAVIGEGYDYTTESADMCDTIYHGTSVAQIIAADCNSLGLTGIAAEAELIPLRCFAGSGTGTVKMLASAIYDAVDVYACDIINMSWGIRTNSKTLRQAIQYAYDAGVILVAAAGNVSADFPQGTKAYPASYDTVISVGAVDSQLRISASSLMNDCVNVSGPGIDIFFVDADGMLTKKGGTSFAAPCVTAQIALLRQLVPDLNTAEIFDMLQERAVDLGDAGYDICYGHGFLRLDELIGRSWSGVRFREEDAAYRIFGFVTQAEACRIAMASYGDDGRMTGLQLLPTSGALYEFDMVYLPEDAVQVRLMYLDPDGLPVAGCDIYDVIPEPEMEEEETT